MPLNITGSNEGSEKNKVFTKKWWKDKHENDLKKLARKVQDDTGKHVVLIY